MYIMNRISNICSSYRVQIKVGKPEAVLSIPSMTDFGSYAALLQSKTSTLLSLALGLIFIRNNAWPSQPQNQQQHSFTYSNLQCMLWLTHSFISFYFILP